MSGANTIGLITMAVTMWRTTCGLVLLAILCNCYALNCRSDGGPKEEDLRIIYRTCLKRQEGKNNTFGRSYDDDWRDPRGRKKSSWDKDSRFGSSSNDRSDDKYGWNDRNRDVRRGFDDRMGGRDDRSNNGDDRGNNGDGMRNRDERISSRDDRTSFDDRMSRDSSGRDGTGRNDGYGRSQVSGRDDFQQSDEFGSDMFSNNYRTSTSSRRYKRSKGMNSGQRSQYNPNPSTQRPYDDNYKNDEKNSSENSSKKDDQKACALHCFLENLEMTGDNGMPDRYLVTHAITKDVKNEDLRDFLQESIEECFQILDNENTEDKCEFSKNLLLCLSEKGRANCDDWREDIQL